MDIANVNTQHFMKQTDILRQILQEIPILHEADRYWKKFLFKKRSLIRCLFY